VTQCDSIRSSSTDPAEKEADACDEGSSAHGAPLPKKRKLSQKSLSLGNPPSKKKLSSATAQTSSNEKKKQVKKKGNIADSNVSYSVASVLTTWNDTTDYGKSFRAMNDDGQRMEVDNLNKGAVKGLKDLIKKKLLTVHYKQIVADKMKQYLCDSKVSQESMFHATPKPGLLVTANLKFLSVGEWVEVDADRTPGFNSEGGIAVIVSVHDDLADVKYVLTKRVEKLVPLRRLTTILMPHRGVRASLRIAKTPAPVVEPASDSCTELRKMSAIQILKHGLASNLWKKQGWLSNMLVAEGLLDGTKQSRKELCWNYYKSQLLYIEAMQDAKNDPSFDPRRSEHQTGKDGKFVKQKNASAMPKNPLTVQYLCNAFDVPYATFKRWKADAFVTTKFVPPHKGKSVLTDPLWASQIYNARKMYLRHGMEQWINKHPSKKNDSKAKKVSGILQKRDVHALVVVS
jgi:hypothetical protein